jgi:FlaG/FlaF family flagellin (archaellin)
MRLKQLLADDDAVSPVIGVILMVAITMILAAVIASFVLGLGGNTETTPTASFDFDYDEANTDLTITHSGGATIRVDELYVRGDNLAQTGRWDNIGGEATGSKGGTSGVVSGNSVDLTGTTNSNYVARVVWESINGDTSSELAVDRGPNA